MNANAKPNGNDADDKGQASGLMVEIKGRIDKWEQIKFKDGSGSWIRTLIVRPAPDVYTHPQTFAVNSAVRLGESGAELAVKCELRPNSRMVEGVRFYNNSLWVPDGR